MSKNAIAKRAADALTTIEQGLATNFKKIESLWPGHGREFCRLSIGVLRQNPTIMQKCTVASVQNCLIEAATHRLQIGGIHDEAYIVPYGKEATLIVSYRGYLKAVRRHPDVRKIICHVVGENDEFSYEPLREPPVKHVPALQSPGEPTHVYAVFNIRQTGEQYVEQQAFVWTRDQIDEHKEKYSPSWKGKDSPWQTAWNQMAMKTVLKAACRSGLVPVAGDVAEMIASEPQEVEGSVVTSDPPADVWDGPTDHDSYLIEKPKPKSLAECQSIADVDWYEGEYKPEGDDESLAADHHINCDQRRNEILREKSERANDAK